MTAICLWLSPRPFLLTFALVSAVLAVLLHALGTLLWPLTRIVRALWILCTKTIM